MFGAYVGVKVASGGFLTENDAIDSHATVAAATGGASLVAVWALTRPRLRPLAVMATPVAGLAVGYALAGMHGASGAEEGAVWMGGACAVLGVVAVVVALLVSRLAPGRARHAA